MQTKPEEAAVRVGNFKIMRDSYTKVLWNCPRPPPISVPLREWGVEGEGYHSVLPAVTKASLCPEGRGGLSAPPPPRGDAQLRQTTERRNNVVSHRSRSEPCQRVCI